MLNKRFQVICCAILWIIASPVLTAQIHFQDRSPYQFNPDTLSLLVKESWNILDSLQQQGYIIKRMDILEMDGELFLLPDGLNQVFSRQDGKWRNLYNGLYLGYNYNSHKFTWNGRLYSFGGRGFWRQHGDLIAFNTKKGEWDLVMMEGYEHSGTGLAFTADSFLYVMQPVTYEQGFAGSKREYPSFRIHLGTYKNSPFSHPRIDQLDTLLANWKVFETEKYLFLHSPPGYLIDKNQLKISSGYPDLMENVYNFALKQDYFVHSFQDSLVLMDRGGKRLFKCSLDASSLNPSIPLKKPVRPVQSGLLMIIAGILAMVSIALAMIYRKYAKVRRLTKGPAYKHSQIPFLLPYSGKSITADKLDELLAIQSIENQETLRFRRATLINEINLETKRLTGKKLIQRFKDPEDKRRFLYRIE